MEKVYFIGAGPGDPELITVKGKKIVEKADVIIYAGSLVNREIINCHKEGADIYNSASMNLDEVMEVTVTAQKAGKLVARVHTGDPSIYGAIREQMDVLDEHGIEYEVIPGVSSFVAAAAAIKKVVKKLLKHYDESTPIAIVQKASWKDQKIAMGTLGNIEEIVKKEKITKTAQILVGNFMGNEYSKSKLYDKTFTHEYRKGIKE